MSAPEDLSLLEYARLHGLAIDHLQLRPLDHLPDVDEFEQDLADPLGTTRLEEYFDFGLGERICIDEPTAALLNALTRPPETPPPPATDALESRRRDRKNAYIETPLLGTDHDSDLKAFTQRHSPDLARECRSLPLEDINDEADEGLGWPKRYQKLPEQIMDAIASEKLVADGQVLHFLSATSSWAMPEENGDARFEEWSAQKEFSIWQRHDETEDISPSLVPFSPETLPDVPSSNPDRLVISPDQTVPPDEEMRSTTGSMIHDNRIASNSYCHGSSSQVPECLVQAADCLSDVENPLEVKDVSPAPPATGLHVEKYNAATTFTPRCSQEYNALTETLTKTASHVPNHGSTQEEVASILEGYVEPHEIVLKKQNEVEKLAIVVSRLKIPVPIMDFSKPIASWDNMTNPIDQIKSAQLDTLDDPKGPRRWNIPQWPLSRDLELSLRWNPFPICLGQIDLHEDIADDGSIDEYIKQPDCVDIDALLWKREGLRILDQLEEMEEIEESSFPIEHDTHSRVRKRKLDMDRETCCQETTSKQSSRESLQDSRESNMLLSKCVPDTSCSKLNSRNQLIENTASSRGVKMNSLEGFITVRGCLLQEHDERHDKPDRVLPQKLQSRVPKMIATSRPASEITDKKILQTKSLAISIPRGHRAFIVSEAFLGDRKLARHIQSLWPSLEMFVRGSQSLGSTLEIEKTITRRSNSLHESRLSCDADVIISPSTGLLYTTLQQIRQRPLPGHHSYTPVQARVIHTAAHFERLIVLISQDETTAGTAASSDVMSELTKNDCDVLDQFTDFVSRLEDNILTSFVKGGKEELANWIVAKIAEYSIPTIEQALSHEETPQERFLRKAGMNAFAAQATLMALRQASTRPDLGEPDESYLGSRDLATFVNMSSEDRLKFFQSSLGGEKLLRRVGHWLSAPD